MQIIYARLGIDTEYSSVPVDIREGEIVLADAMYDLTDTPLYMEAVYLGFPVLLGLEDYFNPVTRLYMRLEE